MMSFAVRPSAPNAQRTGMVRRRAALILVLIGRFLLTARGPGLLLIIEAAPDVRYAKRSSDLRQRIQVERTDYVDHSELVLLGGNNRHTAFIARRVEVDFGGLVFLFHVNNLRPSWTPELLADRLQISLCVSSGLLKLKAP